MKFTHEKTRLYNDFSYNLVSFQFKSTTTTVKCVQTPR